MLVYSNVPNCALIQEVVLHAVQWLFSNFVHKLQLATFEQHLLNISSISKVKLAFLEH